MILAVRSSGAVTSLTQVFMSKENSRSGELSLNMFNVNTTSLAVNGCPSLQVTPLRSLIVSSLASALYVADSASQGTRPGLSARPIGHFTASVQYGFQKKNGSYMKCQPVRCWARRNGFDSVASWN